MVVNVIFFKGPDMFAEFGRVSCRVLFDGMMQSGFCI